jgi:hypothetical protein
MTNGYDITIVITLAIGILTGIKFFLNAEPAVPHVCGDSNHKFEARYDEVQTECECASFKMPSPCYASLEEQSDAIRKVMFRDVYLKDVCIHCGKEIPK